MTAGTCESCYASRLLTLDLSHSFCSNISPWHYDETDALFYDVLGRDGPGRALPFLFDLQSTVSGFKSSLTCQGSRAMCLWPRVALMR
jgi:hypothetical protein